MDAAPFCPSDADLMAQVREGNLEAFEELARRWRKPLLRFFSSLTWNTDDSEDGVQATLMRLWRARGRYIPCGKFSTYLFQIAKRYWLNERASCPAPSVALETVTELTGLTYRDFNHPEGHLLARYRNNRVQKAVLSLPESQRWVLVLCHFEGMSQQEAAEILEIPLGTVKSRMNAAFRHLRQALGDLVDD
jgi:RNA polymerase sigma-70 factor (ECF subfamily)